MAADDPHEVAAALRMSIGLLVRRLRQTHTPGALSLPESSALSRLDREGPTTASILSRRERISPQSMGATVAGLEARGLLARAADPDDGRRVVLSLTKAGTEMLRHRRSVRTERLATALAADFTREERAQLLAATPLIERLAQRL